MNKTALAPISVLLPLLLLAAACGDEAEEAAASEAKAPYPAYSKNSTLTYVGSAPGGGDSTMVLGWAGDKTIGGNKYGRFQVKESPDKNKGRGEIWANLKNNGLEVELAGAELELDAKSLFGLVPGYLKGVGDKPLTFKADGDVGVAQTLNWMGTGTFEKPGHKNHKVEHKPLVGSYTLKQKGVTVSTPMGPVSGCYKYEITAKLPGTFSVLGDFQGDLWYSSALGMVKANVTKPITGVGFGLKGGSGFADLGDGWASVYKVVRVGGASSNFSLSTYDREKKFDADKDTHAKMLLEIRWADADMASKDTKPYVNEKFATMTGMFPSTLKRSDVSLLFPEENGKGYVHWIAFVDQAAKNQSKNGIAYQITANHDPKFSHLRMAARIVYKRYTGQ